MPEPNTDGIGANTSENEEAFDVQAWANRMVVYSKGAEIRTVDQLLDAADVDMNKWEICGKPYLNKWSVGAKIKDSSIAFDDGKMSGQVDEHGLVIAPMFQVKLTLVRKEPVAVWPTIQPVECTVEYDVLPVHRTGTLSRRALIFGDNQIGFSRDAATGKLTPYHSRQCLDLALQVARYACVDEVMIAGDFLDLAEWSDKFTKSPDFFHTTQPSIEESFFWLRQFRTMLPGAEITLKLGNHEARMSRAIQNHLPQAYGLTPVSDGISIQVPASLSLRNLLQLDKLAVDFDDSPSSEVEWINDFFGVCHGDIIRQTPGATARAYVEKYRKSVAFFHSHRAESITLPSLITSGMSATAINPGCMCHVDGRVPGSRRDSNWTNGFLIADYNGCYVTFTPVQVIGDRALFDRYTFTANREDHIVEKIRESFDRWDW